MIHPVFGKAKSLFALGKYTYKTMYEAFLKSPKIGITWDRAINAAKAGNFKAAQEGFKKVDEVMKAIHPDEIQMPKQPAAKPRETINAKAERIEPKKYLEAPKKQIGMMEKEISKPKGKPKMSPEGGGIAFEAAKGSKHKVNKNVHFDNKITNLKTYKPSENIRLRQSKTPIETPSVIEMALEKYMPKKEKSIAKIKESTQKNQQDYVNYLNQREKALEQLTWEEAKKIFKQQNSGLTEKGLSLLKIKHEQKLKDATKRFQEVEKKAVDNTYKVKQKINKDIKQQDISTKGLVAQKDYLMDHIDKAIAKRGSGSETITFNVPGDGTFKIKDNEKSLNSFKKDVEKNWPKKAESKFKVPTGYTKKKIGKPSTKDEIVKKFQDLDKEYTKVKEKIIKIGERTLRRKPNAQESLSDYLDKILEKNHSTEALGILNEYDNLLLMRENLTQLHGQAPD